VKQPKRKCSQCGLRATLTLSAPLWSDKNLLLCERCAEKGRAKWEHRAGKMYVVCSPPQDGPPHR
jgi:hypothetical protein